MRKKEIMDLAIDKAKKNMNSGKGGPFGAAIVKDDKVICVTSNSVLKDQDATCHAEINAIREASKKLGTYDLAGCELYATGYPCPMCMGAIVWANIGKVYYGSELEDATDIGFRDEAFYDGIKEDKLEEIVNLKELSHKECVDLLKEYNDKSKEMY